MTLIQMSFSGAVLIAAILTLRLLLIRRFPKRTFTVLWLIAAVRLIVPFSLPYGQSIYSLISKIPMPSGYAPSPASPLTGQDLPLAVPSVSHRMFSSLIPSTHISAVFMIWLAGFIGFSVFFILLWIKFRRSFLCSAPVDNVFLKNWFRTHSLNFMIWLAGFIGFSVFFILLWIKFRRSFLCSAPVDNVFLKNWFRTHSLKRPFSVRQLPGASSPFTAGIFRPAIYMPQNTDWDNTDFLSYILEHEYIHIRRFDHIFKLLLTLSVCLHWFNPLVWTMYFLANRDIELACDEAVLQAFGMNQKSCYARILISMEESKYAPSPLSTGFCRTALEERITAIMKTKKFSVPVRITACLFILAAVLFCMIGVYQIDAAAGFSTPQAALDAYLNAFSQKDADALSSIYPPESFSRAAKHYDTTPAKLQYAQSQALSAITNSFEGYTIFSLQELSQTEIARTFPEYPPDGAFHAVICWTDSDSPFSLYPVCFKERWYIMYPPLVQHVYVGAAPDNS